jgi:hypothetical protein
MFSKEIEKAPVKTVDAKIETESYRTPRVVDLGDAIELVQRDGSGHLRDGTGGWYVYNS